MSTAAWNDPRETRRIPGVFFLVSFLSLIHDYSLPSFLFFIDSFSGPPLSLPPSHILSSIPPRRMMGVRSQSILSPTSNAREFKVVLDNGTVYVDQALAEALGWSPTQTEGVSLTLSGWGPHYFAIARTGTDSGRSKA